MNKYKRQFSLLERVYFPEIFKGIILTALHFFRNITKPKNIVTIQYPEKKREISPIWRFRHRLKKRDDGSPRCVACMMCPTACPAKCITVVAGEHSDPIIEKYPVRFDIDILRCVFCGLCVEACPVDAIAMDTGITDVSNYSRVNLIYDKEYLLNWLH